MSPADLSTLAHAVMVSGLLAVISWLEFRRG